MRYLLIIILALSVSVLGQKDRAYRSTEAFVDDSLVATASVDTIIGVEISMKQRIGAATFWVKATVNSGTVPAGGIQFQYRAKGINASTFGGSNGTTWNQLGTYTAAQATAGDMVYISMANLPTWSYFDKVQIRAICPSGTYNIDLETWVDFQ